MEGSILDHRDVIVGQLPFDAHVDLPDTFLELPDIDPRPGWAYAGVCCQIPSEAAWDNAPMLLPATTSLPTTRSSPIYLVLMVQIILYCPVVAERSVNFA